MNCNVDLGWLRRYPTQQVTLSDEEKIIHEYASYFEEVSSSSDNNFIELLMNYNRAASNLQCDGHTLHHTLRTKWYLSEMEEVMRYSLFLHSKVIFELPIHSSEDHAIDGFWREGAASYKYSFFNDQAIERIFEWFGDAASGKEILLLPKLEIANSEGHLGETLPPELYNEFYFNVIDTWRMLASSETLGIQDKTIDISSEDKLGLPFFAEGNIKDLISLRRDESDAFLRWREYLDGVMSSSVFTEIEIYQSINQGLLELSDRIQTIKRKGLLDKIGTTAYFFAVAAGVHFKEMGFISASFGLTAGVATALKSLIERQSEYKKYSKEPLYFAWLAQRVR